MNLTAKRFCIRNAHRNSQRSGNADSMMKWITFAAICIISFSPACKKAADIPGLLFSDPGEHPRVTRSSPLPGQNGVALDTPIFIEFDRSMDRQSVQDSFSFSGTASSEGEFRWVGNRLYYDLDKPLSPGASYELTLGKNAIDKDGRTLGIPYYLSFYAGSRVDAPVIESMTPAPSADSAPPGTAIEILFSRSMNPASVVRAFQISPAVEGAIEWENQNQKLIFMPYRALEVGRSYSAIIAKGAKDTEGIEIANRFSATFQVGDDFDAPAVVNVYESGNPVSISDNGTGILKNSKFTIEFDEPMHYKQTLRATSIRKRDGGPALNAQLSWSENFKELQIDPSEPLEPETEYRIRIGTSATDQAGNRLEDVFTLDFTVDNSSGGFNSNFLSLLRVKKVYPGDIEELSSNQTEITTVELPSAYGGGWSAIIQLEFSHPVDTSSLLPENVTISSLAGSFSGSVHIKSVEFDGTESFSGNIVRLELRNLFPNLYRLRIRGSRSGVRSRGRTGELSTWMSDDRVIYFRPAEQ